MSDITQMTSAELVRDHEQASMILSQMAVIDSNKSYWQLAPSDKRHHDEQAEMWRFTYAKLSSELDRRCTDAGIFSNGDGTFKSEPRFNMTVKEANEWLALSQYMVSKIKNER